MSKHYTFEYLSDTGIKPLGSKGVPSEATYQAKFEFDKQIPVRHRRKRQNGKST